MFAPSIFPAVGFVATLIAKIVTYYHYSVYIPSINFDVFGVLTLLQSDILLFLFLLILIFLQSRYKEKKGARYWFTTPVFVVVFIYFIYSIVNLKWILESGTYVTWAMITDVIARPHDLLLISLGYGKMYLTAIVIVIFVALLVRYKVGDFKITFKKSEKILCTTLLSAVLLFPYISNQDTHFGDLYMHPAIAQLKASPFFEVIEDLFSKKEARAYVSRGQSQVVDIGSIAQRPNIVFIILESVGARHVPLLKNKEAAKMPFLEKIAASNNSVVVDNVRTPLPHTSKAVFALLTGTYPVTDTYLAETELGFPAMGLPEYLAAQGYSSVFFQSALGSFERRPALVYNLGFNNFVTAQEMHLNAHVIGTFGVDDFLLHKGMIDWLDKNTTPFVMTILTSASHHPYALPNDADVSYAGFREMDPEVKKEKYYRTLEYTDNFIKETFDLISKYKTNPDGTIFVIVGDHGEAFGEHGKFAHSQVLYDEVLKVPLVIYWRGKLQNREILHQQFSTIDIVPTVLHMIGAQKIPDTINGIDILTSQKSDRDIFFINWLNSSTGLVTSDGYKYIYDFKKGMIEKYDTLRDPHEIGTYSQDIKSNEKTTIERLLLDWKKSMFDGGYDVTIDSSAPRYGWMCMPSGNGECVN